MLPTDAIVAGDIKATEGQVVSIDDIDDDLAIFDIGPDTAQNYADAITTHKTILWNGPLGVTENEAFSGGTRTAAATASP
jgi:phosphoglycerate kinase